MRQDAAAAPPIPMNYLLGAAPLSNGEGPGPLFGPPLKTSIFHHGALIFPGFLVGDWETTQLHNIAQLAPSPSPQQHRPPPSSSKDAADVLWQRQISHKCHPPWQPPRLRSMAVTVVAPAAKCSCCNDRKHHRGDAVGGGSGRGGAGIGIGVGGALRCRG